MKKIISIAVLVVALASTAYADWVADFLAAYNDKGIEPAVTEALKTGQGPQAIIDEGLKIQELNPQNLLKALYCAGVKGDDIKTAADAAGISDILIVAAYEKSVAECGDRVVDTQAYTPVGPSFAGVPSPGSPDGSYASPSTF